MRINVLQHNYSSQQLFVRFSVRRIMHDACRYRLRLRYVREYPGLRVSIVYAPISITPWHQRATPHQFAFPFAYSVTLSSRASASSSAGPVIIGRSSGIASRTSRNVLTTNGLFYRFAKRQAVTLDTYIYHIRIVRACISRVCKNNYMPIRDGRVGLGFEYTRIHVRRIIVYHSLLHLCFFFFSLFDP